MLIKLGDMGEKVAEVQKLLSLLGYDLVIDGDFDSKTQRSVRAFQKKHNLDIDGIVGSETYQALKAAQKRSAKEIKNNNKFKVYGDLEVISNHLPSNQFIKQVFDKKQIFIHFTAGGPSADSVIKWWDSTTPAIATAFVIDRNNGKINEAFNPDYWSFHLGIKGTNGKLDKSSIGIEICSWGPLVENKGKYYNYLDYDNNTKKNKFDPKHLVSEQNVYKLQKEFRGYKYYEKYTDEQLNSLEKLLIFLVKEYNIPVQKNFAEDWFEFKPEVIKNVTPGIWTHVNVRKDKYDSYPDQRLLDLLNKISNQVNK